MVCKLVLAVRCCRSLYIVRLPVLRGDCCALCTVCGDGASCCYCCLLVLIVGVVCLCFVWCCLVVYLMIAVCGCSSPLSWLLDVVCSSVCFVAVGGGCVLLFGVVRCRVSFAVGCDVFVVCLCRLSLSLFVVVCGCGSLLLFVGWC